MRIAVIGAGGVGATLGEAFVARGHDVRFGVRRPEDERTRGLVQRLGPRAGRASLAEATRISDLVVLATPWTAVEEVLREIGGAAGKIIVDCTNPLAVGAEGVALAVGHTTSGGEIVQRLAPKARVVKAFNTTGHENMARPLYGSQRAVMFVAGDDAPAKSTVAGLATEIGFEVVDAGPLWASRYLEAHAMLWIHLALVQGLGRDCAFALMRRGGGRNEGTKS